MPEEQDNGWYRFDAPTADSMELYNAIGTVIDEQFDAYEQVCREDGNFRYIAAVEQDSYGGVESGFRHRDTAVFAVENAETCDAFYGRPGQQTGVSLLVRGETTRELMNDIAADIQELLED